ncbi:hypothetical protein [Adlercreutzia muris]|uniref:hypothetical protein n=1 Tax=Adlercreutzia muris TaxID=1796610 RepID=UPI001F561992|nr:hypothetical protein [Adlercreutzia muris]
MSFQELLILSYFKEHEDDYDLAELRELLGLGAVKLQDLLNALFELEMLVYEDHGVQITDKGLTCITANNMEDWSFCSYLDSGDEESCIERVYYPSRFLRLVRTGKM